MRRAPASRISPKVILGSRAIVTDVSSTDITGCARFITVTQCGTVSSPVKMLHHGYNRIEVDCYLYGVQAASTTIVLQFEVGRVSNQGMC